MRGGWMTRSVDGGLRIPGGTAEGEDEAEETRRRERGGQPGVAPATEGWGGRGCAEWRLWLALA